MGNYMTSVRVSLKSAFNSVANVLLVFLDTDHLGTKESLLQVVSSALPRKLGFSPFSGLIYLAKIKG